MGEKKTYFIAKTLHNTFGGRIGDKKRRFYSVTPKQLQKVTG
jgi:hypothetical protein